MAKANQNLFLISSNIEFKKPLRLGDKFYVTCKMIQEGKIRIGFEQEVRLTAQAELKVRGINYGVCINGNNRNRPYIPEQFSKYLQQGAG